MTTQLTARRPEAPQTRGFRHHLTAYFLVMLLLVAINLAVGEPYWVVWAGLGWGIGLLAHGFAVRPKPNRISPPASQS